MSRWVIYVIGMLVLALGLTLNTKTGLGVSPILSLAYCSTQIWGVNLGDATAAAAPESGVQPGVESV